MIFLMCHVLGDLLLADDPAGPNLHGHKDVIFNFLVRVRRHEKIVHMQTMMRDSVVT